MSNVIRFLETMGRSAELRHATKPALYKAMNDHGVDQDAQWAILRGDEGRLEAQLGARSEMDCPLEIACPDDDAVAVFAQEVRQIA